MLDPTLVRLVAVIEDTGSFAAAADVLRVTPAAVTQQVARLERELGAPIAVRGPRGARLAPLGRVLLEPARAVDAAVRSAEQVVAAARGEWSNRLRVGTFSTAALHLVAPALTSLGHSRPDVDLDVLEIESVDAVRVMNDGRVDLAIRSTFEDEQPLPDTLETHRLLDDPLVVVLPENHLIARSTPPGATVQLSVLAADPWIAILKGTPARRQFDTVMERAGIRPDVRYETAGYDVAQAFVGAGVAVALLSRLVISPGSGVAFRELVDPPVRGIEALTNRRHELTPLVDDFLRAVREVAAEVRESFDAVR